MMTCMELSARQRESETFTEYSFVLTVEHMSWLHVIILQSQRFNFALVNCVLIITATMMEKEAQNILYSVAMEYSCIERERERASD